MRGASEEVERGDSTFHVMVRLRSRLPVALAVLLVLLQLISPSRAWVILIC